MQVTADGRPLAKLIGMTIDWSTVAAVGSDTTLEDGIVIKAGEKYLRYGQVVTAIGVAEVQTVTFTGGPTAGSTVLTLPAAGNDAAEAAAAIAFNASAATFQATLEAMDRIGPGGVSVTRSGAGSNGDPYIYTVTFDRLKGNVPQFTSTHSFTGGTTPTTTHGTTTAGSDTGNKYGPYDSGASDGRQTIARDTTFIMNHTVRELDIASDHAGEAIYGGQMWKPRIIATAGSASLAAGPTWANLQTALPMMQLVSG